MANDWKHRGQEESPRLEESAPTRSPKASAETVLTGARRTGIFQPEITSRSVEAHALETFGSEAKAEHWLSRRNPVFQGKTPRQIIKVDPLMVEAELVRIDHGVYI